MKKTLLTAALLSMGAFMASAANFELYVGTESDASSNVTNYVKVNDGDTFKVENYHMASEYDLPGFYMAMGELAVFPKIVNTSNSAITVTIDKKEVYNKSEIPVGSNGQPIGVLQTCIGSCYDTPFPVEVAANSETAGVTGNHLGYTITFSSKDQKEKTAINSEYLYTFSDGTTTIKFNVVYGKDDSGVEAVEFDENLPKEYYNMQGVRVVNPQQGGIYIVRQGNKVAKQVIR